MKHAYLFVVFLLVSVSLFCQEKRLALIIGNSKYEHCGVLINPANDALSMKKALTEVGFEVQEYYNLSQREMKKAIDDFGLKLKGYNVGLFFYAGHGIQANGNNFLIPVDANLINERQIEYDCVQANRVLSFMENSGAEVNIVILDACRNNPFERSWDRSASSKGLAFMDAPAGTLIAYATAPGSTASDGSGKNGLYTSAILESIQIPNITALQMFQNVRSVVSEKSGSRQIPWESTSLIGDFYFYRNEELGSPLPYSSSKDISTGSRGVSTTIIDGYPVTQVKFGKSKGLYLREEKLTRRDFSLMLKEADSEYWITMDKAWSNNILAITGVAFGGAAFIGYGIASEVTADTKNEKIYTITAYSGLGMMGIGVLCWWSGYRQYNRVMKYYFPDNYSHLQIGPIQNGFGLAINF
jgi:hypothetical protein